MAKWVSIGPTNFAGRVNVLAPHPTMIDTLLAGTDGGGIWKTTDGGVSWMPLTDDLPVVCVSALAFAPSEPLLVYAGTGQSGSPNGALPGIGVIQSRDGGQTWVIPGAVLAQASGKSHPGFKKAMAVGKSCRSISVDPTDASHLVIGTDQSAYFSKDTATSSSK